MTKIILLCALLLPSALPAEEFTMDTYYPSPVGVYNNVTVTSTTALASDGGYVVIGARNSGNPHQLMVEGSAGVNFVQMTGYTNANILAASIKPGETKPLPGRLLFNKDQNKFFYSSVYAVASDPSTWLLPLDGFDTAVMGEAATTANYPLTGSMSYIRPLKVTVGAPNGTPPSRIRLVDGLGTKLKKSGFYVVESKGEFCSPDLAPRIKVDLYYNSTKVADLDEELEPVAIPGCHNYTVGGMVFLRAGQIITFGSRARRFKPGEYIKAGATLKMERILGF